MFCFKLGKTAAETHEMMQKVQIQLCKNLIKAEKRPKRLKIHLKW